MDFLLCLFWAEGESEEEVEVASDEEKDIVKAIREEITQLIAAEMKDELEIYNRYSLCLVIWCWKIEMSEQMCEDCWLSERESFLC